MLALCCAVLPAGELVFVLVGVICQGVSLLSEALRLTLVQVLLQRRGFTLTPLSTMYHISPVCLAALLVPLATLEAEQVGRAECDVWREQVAIGGTSIGKASRRWEEEEVVFDGVAGAQHVASCRPVLSAHCQFTTTAGADAHVEGWSGHVDWQLHTCVGLMADSKLLWHVCAPAIGSAVCVCPGSRAP